MSKIRPLFYIEAKDKTPSPILPFIREEVPEYKTFQLIPDRSIENGRVNEEILLSLSALVDFPFKVDVEQRNLTIRPFHTIYYEILYEGSRISFNYTIPDLYQKVLYNKIQSTYKQSTLKERDDYYSEFAEKYCCNFIQKQHFMYSLNVDYRENGLVENLLTMCNNIQENDKVLLQFAIIALDDNWKIGWKNAYDKVKQGKELKVSTNIPQMIFDTTFKAGNSALSILDMFLGQSHEQQKKEENINEMNNHERHKNRRMTMQKINYNGYQVQIKLLCNNDSKLYYYSKLFEGVFRLLEAEQQLTVDKIKVNKYPERKFDFQVHKNIYSTKELATFLQLPNKRLQVEYKKFLQSIETIETQVPKELMTGDIPIGDFTYKGNIQTAYWNNNKNVLALPKIVMAGMGGGKTTYSQGFIRNARCKGDGIIVFDYIKNCEFTNDIKDPDCIIINLETDFCKFALAYPEIQASEADGPWERLKVANMLARQTEFLINSLNVEPLSARMTRYLDSACKVVYIFPGTKVMDVINVLSNHITRRKYIDRAIDSGCFAADDAEIIDLLSLNEYDKKSGMIVGTSDSKIEHILDRVNVLNKDIYLRAMMKADIDYSCNFIEWLDEGKTVFIQLPESTFTNKQVKDTIVTYFTSRLWLATLKRKNWDKICHVMYDEIHQCTTCSTLLATFITEARKFGIGFYFTIHFLKQFKALLDAIKSSGASYMLLAGTEKENFNALQEELSPFTLDDFLQLKPFHSLNYINYGNQYVKFISKLPKPL